jgi:two-component system chemotaxis response regulator CheB
LADYTKFLTPSALAQSDATCVVYGMPKAIVDAGLADDIVDLDDDMALAIMSSLCECSTC